MIRRLLALGLVGITALACGGGTASVADNPNGTSSSGDTSSVEKQTDGSSTGNGTTCSWAGTALSQQTGNKDTAAYPVGATFPSLDGCNDCSCTTQGISCTKRGCGGSSSSSGAQGCTTEAMICPDGKTAVGRTGPNCEFAPCPVVDAGFTGCSLDAMKCPDGTIVGRTGPKCEFVCPTVTCDSLQKKAEDKVAAVINASFGCNTPDDCTNVAFAADCFSACSRVMSKSGLDKLDQAKKDVNENECKAFKQQSCKLSIPPCVAPLPPKCVDHVCQ